ncbi:hypothetical protein ACFRLW_12865 [Streptomyces sp. NPDC056728]
MNARDDIAAHFTSGALADELLDAYRAEILAEFADPANAQTIYADRPCVCDETPHPTWCPASVPTDERIAEIRQGSGDPLTPRELAWLSGTASRHELHVIAARGGHWPLTDDPAGALLLVSQYLAAAVAVIERAEHVEEKATAAAATATPAPFIEDARLRALHEAMRNRPAQWRSVHAARALRDAGFTGLGRNVAKRFLRALAEQGLATAHGPDDGRYYTVSRTGEDGRA